MNTHLIAQATAEAERVKIEAQARAEAEAIRIRIVAEATAESIRQVNAAIREGGESYLRHEQVMTSMRLFVQEVMPAVR